MDIKASKGNDTDLGKNSSFTTISHYSFENTEQTFIELASEQRLSILFKLSEQDTKLSKLAKDLNVTMQEIHRNVNRLMDVGLIKKNSDGTFSLTTFGNTIIKQIPAYDFLSRNKEYFSGHFLGEIPMKFIQRIGALDNSEYIHGMVAVMERWKQIYKESADYIYGMLPQIPLDLIESVIPKIKEDGIKFNYILPQKAAVPKKRTELLKDAGFYDLLKNLVVLRRPQGVQAGAGPAAPARAAGAVRPDLPPPHRVRHPRPAARAAAREQGGAAGRAGAARGAPAHQRVRAGPAAPGDQAQDLRRHALGGRARVPRRVPRPAADLRQAGRVVLGLPRPSPGRARRGRSLPARPRQAALSAGLSARAFAPRTERSLYPVETTRFARHRWRILFRTPMPGVEAVS